MQNYKKNLKKFIDRKYKNCTVQNSNFIKSYIKNRTDIKKKLIKNNSNFNIKKIKNNDTTFNELLKFYQERKKKNYAKRLIKYYQKFEVNLKLKRTYNKNLIKISETETSVNSYLLLGLSLNKYNFINNLQKFNCILKIIDKIIYKDKNLKYSFKNLLLKLINVENKYFNKIYDK